MEDKGTSPSISSKIDAVFSAQTDNRWAVARAPVKERIEKLKQLERWILNNKQRIRDAVYNDFKKPATDVDLTEIFTALTEIRHAVKHLKKWAKPHPVKRTLALITTKSWIQYEARGLVLIIAPWNYPFNLVVVPLISAIAAGNCIVLKPSELASHTSSLISAMIGELFPENEVAVFEGEKEVAIKLLKRPFDHIFFTGSTAIGKKVMEAASKNLSTITLELGGKSPTLVDETANLDDAAQKVVWSKFMNCGQTCLAPDYILVHKSVHKDFVEAAKKALDKFYSTSAEELELSNDYARVIDKNNFKRLSTMLDGALEKGAVLEVGGKLNSDEKYIPATVLSNVSLDSPIMEEEIFGPLLPIITYEALQDAISIIKSMPKPLALYVFSKDQKNIDMVLSDTTSGGVCINDTVIHFSQSNLPLGGVNASGMGRSHGFFGFKTFSNEKAVIKHHRFSILKLMYPPYTNRVKKLVKVVLKYL